MDVTTLINRAQRIAGRVDSGFDSRTLQFLNEAVDFWARANPWPGLKRTGSFYADGTRNLVLPQHVFHVQAISDRTNHTPLEAKEPWDTQAPDEYLSDTAGAAFWWRETGMVPVTQQPVTPAQLSVRTDVSDSFTAYVAGFAIDTNASGTPNYEYFQEESLSVAGSVASTTANMYVRVMTVGKNDFTSADLKIYNGATLIGRVPANKYRSEYRNIEFITIPAAGTELRINYLETPNPLTSAYQHPHPSINPEFLAWYAAGLIHKAQNESDQGELCFARANQILAARSHKDKSHGDRDLGGYPDVGYWNTEDIYTWP